MSTAAKNRMTKINDEIEKLIKEKEALKAKIKSEMIAEFSKLNFEEFAYDDVKHGLRFIKQTLSDNTDVSQSIINAWKESAKKTSIKKDEKTKSS